MHSKAFDSCNYLCISGFWGLWPQTHTEAPPLDPTLTQSMAMPLIGK